MSSLPLLLTFSKWETEPTAGGLTIDAEAAIKSIGHHTRNLAKHAALPDFAKFAVMIVWRLNPPTPAAKIQSLPERASDLGSMESSLIHLSRESIVSNIHCRNPVATVDVAVNGKDRGKQLQRAEDCGKVSQAQKFVDCPWCSRTSEQINSYTSPLTLAG